MEHYEEKFGVPSIKEYIIKIAKIVAWNIWQMDGIKFVIPNSCHTEMKKISKVVENYSLFDDSEKHDIPDDPEELECECPGCEKNDHSKHNGFYCRIYDWPANESVEFFSFIKKGAQNNGEI